MNRNEALSLAARITDALRDRYSIRLPARGVLEFVPRDRLIEAIAHVIELETR
jgi:hypothetical protein